MPDVQPFLLPRDYNTTSAEVVPAEMAAPLAVTLSGLRRAPSVHKGRVQDAEHAQANL